MGDGTEEAVYVKENIDLDFHPQGFDIRIHNFRGDHRLRISNLKDEIVPEESSIKHLSTKTIVVLKKKDETKTWYSLIKKND